MALAPNAYGLCLSSEHCALAIRQRINAPLFDDMPNVCSCGAALRGDASEYGHVHWCPTAKPPATTRRHNRVAMTLHSLAEDAGGHLDTLLQCGVAGAASCVAGLERLQRALDEWCRCRAGEK